MLRFVTYALPLLVLLLALFGFAVDILDFEPQRGSVIKLAILDQPTVPAQLVFGTWLVEASGLLALFLLAQGRCGTWWLDGLVAGWLGWVFRGPLLVVTIVVAARQPHHAWWSLAFGWWVLYSVCGLSLAILARRTDLDLAIGTSGAEGRQQALQQAVAFQRGAEAATQLEAGDDVKPSPPEASPTADTTAEDREIGALLSDVSVVEAPSEEHPSQEPQAARGEEP